MANQRPSTVRQHAPRAAAAALVTLSFAACSFTPAPLAPMQFVLDRAPSAVATRCLLVLLPGVGDSTDDLVRRGMVAMVRKRRIAADVIVADAHYGYYRTRQTVQRLWEDVLAPCAANYEEVWIAGISIGGLGAILYASYLEEAPHPPVTGILAIAPYLGGNGVASEIEAAGGLRSWQPPQQNASTGQRVFGWLRSYGDPAATRPLLFLGIGTEDKFVRQVRVVAPLLPTAHVVEVPGPHAWPSYLQIWATLLDRAPLHRLPDDA